MLGLLNLRQILLGAALLAAFSAGWLINSWRYDSMYLKMYKNSQNVQNQLQNRLDEEREKKHAEIKVIDSKYKSVIAELRNRTDRGTAIAKNGKACTGAELSREDAEFLVGEATRADKIVVELNHCYTTYENARKILGK